MSLTPAPSLSPCSWFSYLPINFKDRQWLDTCSRRPGVRRTFQRWARHYFSHNYFGKWTIEPKYYQKTFPTSSLWDKRPKIWWPYLPNRGSRRDFWEGSTQESWTEKKRREQAYSVTYSFLVEPDAKSQVLIGVCHSPALLGSTASPKQLSWKERKKGTSPELMLFNANNIPP